ncbi:MAG: DUF58 domain-containing protein [Planctomycetaceae bacterium]
MPNEQIDQCVFARVFGSAHALLHHDFCPWANRWVYWMKHPLCSLALALAASVTCGLLVNPNVLIVSGVIASAIALGVVWPRIVMRGVTGDIMIERRRCYELEPVSVRLRITNRWPWPAWGLYVDGGFFDDTQPVLALSRVSGWSTCEFDWTFVPHRRGVYPHTPPAIATRFPFGLAAVSTPLGVAGRLIVWPETCRLTTLPDAVEADFREDRLTDRQAGEQGDLLGTRDFRRGDSLRRVHWAQTARQGRLIVCEKQASSRCALRIFVDLERVHHTGAGTAESTLEATLRTVASICVSLHERHATVECWLGSSRFDIGTNYDSLRMFLDALAGVPAEGVEGGWPIQSFREDVWTVAVTTDVGRSVPDRNAIPRAITIGTAQQSEASWVHLTTEADWKTVLPARWRRACHVA